MCGNHRKWEGLTRAEKKAIIAFDEMLRELGE
jgi:hypothetical protein